MDLPNQLAASEPCRPTCRSSRLLLLGLVLLCLVPRAVMAWKLGGLCPDGVYYIRQAQALEQGGWRLRQSRCKRFRCC